jgi:hypothetical protein
MSDIVERLRATTDGATVNPDGLEAAAEIEQNRIDLNEYRLDVERLRAALREHACECVCVCMDAKHNYGEIDTPDTCKYGRARAVLAQEKHDG